MLDFITRDYPNYQWSLRTLDRRLRYFNIYYTDTNVTVEEVKDAVKKELEEPGILLGYRAMQQKVRLKHGLNVPRDLVYNVMFHLCPEELEKRRFSNKKKATKEHFVTNGPNWVWSLDGHDKLMGYQNSTFPLAVYGCIDTASRKILWLKVWNTNRKPELIRKWYLEYLLEYKCLPCYLRIDKGTETGTMATIHAYLRSQQGDLEDPIDSVIYGPSTSNQVNAYYD